jgi:hypothetical protein
VISIYGRDYQFMGKKYISKCMKAEDFIVNKDIWKAVKR